MKKVVSLEATKGSSKLQVWMKEDQLPPVGYAVRLRDILSAVMQRFLRQS